MSRRVTKVLQLTDFHLFEDPEKELQGLCTRNSFNAVLHHLDSGNISPDFLVLTGDLAQDNAKSTYQFIAETTRSRFDCPIAWVPGNHDDFSLMTASFEQHGLINCRSQHINNWLIITLNSQIIGEVAGALADEEIARVKKDLKDSQATQVLIFLHHNTLPISSKWLDQYTLKNSEEFRDIIGKDLRVKVVICGHIHQERHLNYKHIDFMSTPSTSFQFKPDCNDYMLDDKMPGYRWVYLFEDGNYETIVVRLPHDPDLLPDLSAEGY